MLSRILFLLRQSFAVPSNIREYLLAHVEELTSEKQAVLLSKLEYIHEAELTSLKTLSNEDSSKVLEMIRKDKFIKQKQQESTCQLQDEREASVLLTQVGI